jgi:CelD/BcsL family acetyltransferase involved in cellulose biosynthesis
LEQNGFRIGILPYHWYAVARLQDGYETYARDRGYNFRKQTRKIAKRVSGAGQVKLDCVTSLDDPEFAFQMRDRMFALAEKSWRTQRAGIQAEYQHRPFYRELFERFGRDHAVDLSILALNGRDAAFNLSLTERGVCYHSMIGYDPQLQEYSPGTYLLQEILKRLPERGIHTVCSHGGYDYKKRWASEVVPQFTFCVFGNGLRAMLSHFLGFKVLRGHLQAELQAPRSAN